MDQALTLLKKYFGYDQFRTHQAEIIDTLLDDQDAFVLMPTGGGKSLCYQIPAILKPGTAIIVSPLIALMQDQVATLKQLGMSAQYLNSSQSPAQIYAIEQEFIHGALDLLYIAPERLLTENGLNLLKQAKINLFAIDEAHCMSSWGHDFRPEYQALGQLRHTFPHVPMVALTATADALTRQDIIKGLNLNNAKTYISSFDRPNIRYMISTKQNPKQQLIKFISQEHPDAAGIVYCLSRKKVDAMTQYLVEQGYDAKPYHAGLDQHTRKANQDYFLNQEGVIVVATIAFGMGIDKSNVRFVAHLDLPKSIEAYYQETGRAGRDGLAADAFMLYGLQDVIQLRQMLGQSQAIEHIKRIEHGKLEAMLGLCETIRCRRQVLLDYFSESLPSPCGNCDNCLYPQDTWSATQAVQKALSCVYRTGQRFGVNHIINVLLGKNDERIEKFRHHQLSTYGIGQDIDNRTWRSIFRQLVALGFLTNDQNAFGALKLTEKCRPVLRGEQDIALRQEQKETTRTMHRSEKRKASVDVPESDQELWQALRQLRLELAQQENVPPYVIFHDATLKAMVQHKPQDAQAFLMISGVGEQKLARFGDAFLAAIKSHL